MLEFLYIGRHDRQEIANWIGVDVELVNLIIDTELKPHGWIQCDAKDQKITLTTEGMRILDDEIDRNEDLQAYYLVQDAITEVWHRLIPSDLALLDVFVFATQHPCFVTLTEKYMTPHSYYDIAIEGQPQKQCYYHRSLGIFLICVLILALS